MSMIRKWQEGSDYHVASVVFEGVSLFGDGSNPAQAVSVLGNVLSDYASKCADLGKPVPQRRLRECLLAIQMEARELTAAGEQAS